MTKSATKKAFLKVMILTILLVLGGCTYYNGTRFYVPRKVPIKPDTVIKPEYKVICSVNVVNNQRSSQWVSVGDYTHEWRANLHMWTDTATGLLESELKKRGVRITEDTNRILELSVTRVNVFWGFNVVGCTVNLHVETGSGYVVDLEETNRAKDIYQSCDGAITKVIAAMFEDHDIQDYLSSEKLSNDEDCDGVTDDTDRCPGTPLGVDVDKYGCPLDADGDGVADIYDRCPGTPKGVVVNDVGCPVDADMDGVPDWTDRCPGTPAGARVDSRGCWILGDLLFALDKYTIRPQYYYLLDEVVRILKRNPDLKIEIQGHTCILGTAKYNLTLSERRAKSVRDYLAAEGIGLGRMRDIGYGYTRPIAPSNTEAGRRLNRRVELHTRER